MFEMSITDKQKKAIRKEVSQLTNAQAKSLLARYAKAISDEVTYKDAQCEAVSLLKGHKHHVVTFSCALSPNEKSGFNLLSVTDFESSTVYIALLKKLMAYVSGNHQFSNKFLKFETLAELELLLAAHGV